MQDFSDNFILYNGKKYFFNAQIYSHSDSSEQLNHGLRNSNILQFEYVNEFNKLFLEGSLTYQDNYGILDKYLEKSLVYVQVLFIEMVQKFDGQITIEKQSETQRFIHKFIVNGIKIVKRENHIITYNLSLVSANWLKCAKTVNFSNYDKDPMPIFDIVKAMLNTNDLNIDKNTFESVLSPVKINYITNGNDNSITSINYLLGKLYYYSSKDTNLKFLVYNESDDMFYIVNTTDQKTYLGNSNIIVSFFKNKIETMLQQDATELNSVTKFPKTSTYSNVRAKIFFDFNYNQNKFINASIPSKSIIDFQNTRFESDTYEKKYDFYTNDLVLNESGSYWNNDFNIYMNTVKTMLEDSALVVNVTGEMLRKPGYFVNLNVDRDIKYVENDSLDKKEEIKNKYRSFEGAWIVSKVRNIIIPGTIQSNKHVFRQNLVLTRNYIKKQK